nr:hypothetical protein Itr_chr11CG20300 [Ipomoea trifida]
MALPEGGGKQRRFRQGAKHASVVPPRCNAKACRHQPKTSSSEPPSPEAGETSLEKRSTGDPRLVTETSTAIGETMGGKQQQIVLFFFGYPPASH